MTHPSSAAGELDFEMGYSVAEFAQVLPLAMRDWAVKGLAPQWAVEKSDGCRIARIELTPLPERAIGALRLPVVKARIRFDDIGDVDREELLLRFQRGFHRGGG